MGISYRMNLRIAPQPNHRALSKLDEVWEIVGYWITAIGFGMCNKVESSCLDFEIMIHEWVAVGCSGNRLL